MKIAIIGLGLIGGSLAYALNGFQDAEIIGADACPSTREKALKTGAVSTAYDNAAAAVQDADLVIFCLYPEQISAIVRENAAHFKCGAVVTDVCGIKASLRLWELLPDGVDYVSCHPMAGKEVSGFDHADGDIFFGAGFIITTNEYSKPESVGLIRRMAEYIGAGEIVCCTAETHDEVIAYTSHLTHLSASALCLSYPEGAARAFTGGAFRDCTRVADINAGLWSSLFLENRENVLTELTRYQNSIALLKNAIEDGDRSALSGLLESAANNKRELLKR